MSTALTTRPTGRRIQPRERGNFLTGCLVVLGIILVLAIAGGVFVYMNWKTWTADLGAAALTAMVEEFELPPDQEAAMITEINALAQDFKDDKITFEQLGMLAQELEDSPAIYVMAASAIRANYVEPSGLTEEEKDNANLQLSRLARGLTEKSITPEEAQNAMDQIIVQTQENQFELRNPEVVTDEDLQEMVEKVTKLADDKGVANEQFNVDVAAEFRKAIDKALGRTTTEAPPAESGEEDPAGQDPGEGGEGETGGEGSSGETGGGG
jgi:hypothetical protein